MCWNVAAGTVPRSTLARWRVMFMTWDTVSPRTRDFLTDTGLSELNKPVQLHELASEVAMVCEMTGQADFNH